jgi:hypothetical protein
MSFRCTSVMRPTLRLYIQHSARIRWNQRLFEPERDQWTHPLNCALAIVPRNNAREW